MASVLSGHRPPRWIQSAVLSVNGTHTNIHTQVAAAFRPGRRGACCPSSVISSSLPPAISVPSALSALPPLLVSSHMATTPPPPTPLCHPLDSFPMLHPPVGASLTALNAPLSLRSNWTYYKSSYSIQNIQFIHFYRDFSFILPQLNTIYLINLCVIVVHIMTSVQQHVARKNKTTTALNVCKRFENKFDRYLLRGRS